MPSLFNFISIVCWAGMFGSKLLSVEHLLVYCRGFFKEREFDLVKSDGSPKELEEGLTLGVRMGRLWSKKWV